MGKRGIPLGEWSGSDATEALRQTIEKYEFETSRQTRTMIRLTWATTLLTIVMALGLGVQIWLTFYPPAPPSTAQVGKP
jgi:hypothetical protein